MATKKKIVAAKQWSEVYTIVLGLAQKLDLPSCDGCGPGGKARKATKQIECFRGGFGPYQFLGGKPFKTRTKAMSWLKSDESKVFRDTYENIVVFDTDIQTKYMDE
jgi:hypothetical protein